MDWDVVQPPRRRVIAIEADCDHAASLLVAWAVREARPGESIRVIRTVMSTPPFSDGADASDRFHDPRLTEARHACAEVTSAIWAAHRALNVQVCMVVGPRAVVVPRAARNSSVLAVCGVAGCHAETLPGLLSRATIPVLVVNREFVVEAGTPAVRPVYRVLQTTRS